jgi:alpha-tubulin suppressor-like RCC1 family protein
LLRRSSSHIHIGLIALVSMAIMTSCTRKQESTSQISIKLPPLSSKFSTQSAVGPASWGVPDPSTNNDLVCFAVVVSAADLGSKTCRNQEGIEVFRAGVSSALFKAGDRLSIEVPSGKQRTVRIVGFAATDFEACAQASIDKILDRSLLSSPHIVGSATVDLEPGVIEMTIPVSVTSALKFNECLTEGESPQPSASPAPTATPIPSAGIYIVTPASLYASNSSIITVSGTCIDGYSISLSGGDVVAPASGVCSAGNYGIAVSFSSSDGTKTLTVSQDDGSTIFNDTRSFVVDLTLPTATITLNPASIESSNSANFQFSGADGGTGISLFECKTDGGSFGICTSPTNYTSLTDGVHTFSVRAVDGASNISSLSTYTWTVDTASPTIVFTSTPVNPSAFNTANFQFTASDAGGTGISNIQCKLDAGAYAPCTSPKNLAGLSEGSHTFTIKAADVAGNLSAPQSLTWVIDTIAPTIAMTTTPNNPDSNNNATFTFSATDSGTGIASYECKLDAAAFVPCTSPKTYTGLTEGAHTVSVRATDLAGNISTSSNFSWTVDTSQPVLTFNILPASPTSMTAQTISGNCSDATSGITANGIKICMKPSGACSYPADYTVSITCTAGTYSYPSALTEGIYDVRVAAVDNVGLYSIAGVGAYIVDTTAPVASVSGAPTGTNNVASLNVTVSGSGVTHYQYKVGLGLICSSGSGYSSDVTVGTAITDALGADGSYTLCVIAKDLAGNYQALGSATTSTWTRDSTVPNATITGHPVSSPNNINSITVDVGGAGVVGYKYKLGINADCSIPTGYSVESVDTADIIEPLSSEGNYVLCVIGRNSASVWQAEASATQASWTRDVTSPAAFTITGVFGGADVSPDAWLAYSEPTFSWNSAVGAVSYNVSIRNNSDTSDVCALQATAALSYTFTGCTLSNGVTYHAKAQAQDSAGNTTLASLYTFTVDQTSPALSIVSPAASTPAITGVFINGACENGLTVNLSGDLAGPATTVCSSGSFNVAITFTAGEGTKDIVVSQTDAAGNTSSVNRDFIRDTTLPTITITGNPSSVSNINSANFTFSGTDANGVALYECELDAGGYSSCTSPKNYSGPLSEASHTFNVRATDTAGNLSTVASYGWTIDVTAPTATLSGTPADPSSDANLNVNVGGAGVTHYKYALGDNTLDCTNAGNYSSEISETIDITSALGTDGAKKLCVIGRDAAVNWQTYGAATVYNWTKAAVADHLTLAGTNTLTSGSCALYTVTAKDPGNNPANVVSPTTVNLGTSGSGLFYSSADSTCTGGSITNGMIAGGTSSATFRYKDDVASSLNLTGSAVGLTSGNLAVTIGPDRLAITGNTSMTSGTCELYTVVAKDTALNTANVLSSTQVMLSDGAGVGIFYASGDTSCSGGAITDVTIANGTSSVAFRYKNTAAESVTLNGNDNATLLSSANLGVTTTLSPAVLSISDSNYNYGTVGVGQSSEKVFTLFNSGASTATALGGTGLAAPFSFKGGGTFPGINGTCTGSLAAAASCTFVVTFSPASSGVQSDTIDINYNNGVSGQTVSNNISGTGQNPPANPTLALSDAATGSANFVRQPSVSLAIANDAAATLWCVSETQSTAPSTGAATCNGGSGPSNGWHTTRPVSTTLSGGDGTKTVYLWVADSIGSVSTGTVSDSIVLDTVAPSSPTVQLSDPNTNSTLYTNQNPVNLSINGDAGAIEWCALEQASAAGAPAAPLYNSGCWTGSEPTVQSMGAQGQRRVYVFIKDPAQNVSAYGFADIEYDTTPPGGFNIMGIQGGTDFNVDGTLRDINAVNVTWNSATGASFYEVVIRDSADTTTICGPQSTGSLNLSFTITGPCNFVDGMQYVARVKAFDTANNFIPAGNSPFMFNVDTATSVTQLVTGTDFACALFDNGRVKCWGGNGSGQLGLGDTQSRGDSAGEMGFNLSYLNLPPVQQLAAGNLHACALLTNSEVKCWGSNPSGQLGINASGTNQANPVSVLNQGGSSNLNGVLQIAAGGTNTCALMSDSSILCWGANTGGQIGDSTSGTSRLLPVFVTSTSGTGTLTGIVKVAVGNGHACAVNGAGGAFCWGTNTGGQIGDNTAGTNRLYPVNVMGLTSGVAEITLGTTHTCALMNNGEAKCWGTNTANQIGDNTTTVRPAPVSVKDTPGTGILTNAVAISTKSNHTCVVLNDNSMKCWGSGLNGALGTENVTNAATPQNVIGVFSAVDLSAGNGFTCARMIAGNPVKCWGSNVSGQLGVGNTTSVGGTTSSMSSLLPVDLMLP